MALILAPLKVAAQEQAQPASPRLSVELNGVDAGAAGCRLTFVAGNGLAATLDRVSFEFVLFDGQGLVERMAVLDFRDLPSGKTKVRQFDLAGTPCEALGSLLINDAPVCEGAGISPDSCMRALDAVSRVSVGLKG